MSGGNKSKRAASGSYVRQWLVNVSGGACKRKRDAIRGCTGALRAQPENRHIVMPKEIPTYLLCDRVNEMIYLIGIFQ